MQTEKQNPIPSNLPKSKLHNRPPDKGKDKMSPLERQLPYPLKQARQKQAADSNPLVAHTSQRAGVLKEQAKIRAVEEARKQANAERLKTSPPSVDTAGSRAQPDPNQTLAVDPEILPETGETTEKLRTP